MAESYTFQGGTLIYSSREFVLNDVPHISLVHRVRSHQDSQRRPIRQSKEASHEVFKTLTIYPTSWGDVESLVLISSSQITKYICASILWTTHQLPPLICPPGIAEVFKVKYMKCFVVLRERSYANLRRLIFWKAPTSMDRTRLTSENHNSL